MHSCDCFLFVYFGWAALSYCNWLRVLNIWAELKACLYFLFQSFCWKNMNQWFKPRISHHTHKTKHFLKIVLRAVWTFCGTARQTYFCHLKRCFGLLAQCNLQKERYLSLSLFHLFSPDVRALHLWWKKRLKNFKFLREPAWCSG